MRITECPWEIANLGCRVAEIQCDALIQLDEAKLHQVELNHDYIVVKVPMRQFGLNSRLGQLGSTMVETQISLRINARELRTHCDFIEALGDVSIEKVQTNEEKNQIIDQMTENMFSTDRIYLDSHFGPSKMLQRYRNWTNTEFQRESELSRIITNGDVVGFMLTKKVENTLYGLLGGLFEQYQNQGIGIIIPLFAAMLSTDFRRYETKISSNNFPVLQLYNQCGYKITNLEYVFVKHKSN